jgi:predicted nucleotidyltransferase
MQAPGWSVDEARLMQALTRVVERVNPTKIIAFGSRATGNARPDSDLDLAILFDGPPTGAVSGAAWRTFAKFHIPSSFPDFHQRRSSRDSRERGNAL